MKVRILHTAGSIVITFLIMLHMLHIRLSNVLCLMVQGEAPMTRTQPGRRNHSCWKVCTQVWLGTVTQNDESDAPL